MDNWAVFTGDIVKSSDLSSAELTRVFDHLTAAGDTIAGWQDNPTYFTRYRGDGWQIAVSPKLAFRAALALRAAVRSTAKGIDTRVALGMGAGRITGRDLAGAEGAAFVRSGRALDDMKRTTRMSAPEAPMALRIALPMADHILGGWTARQSQIALLLLPPSGPTHEAVADQLGLTRQAVQKQAESSGMPDLLDVCTLIEEEFDQ